MSDEKMREPLSLKEWDSVDDEYRAEHEMITYHGPDFSDGWRSASAHSAARIAELEGQVTMLRDAFSVYPDVSQLLNVLEQEWRQQGAWSDWDESTVTEFRRLGVIISATAQTAEEYRRRVKAQALEEAAQTLGKERNYGVDPYSKLLRMASELRNSDNQAEGKGEKV